MTIDLKLMVKTQGIQPTMAIVAALAVAKARWTCADTIQFGTKMRDLIGVEIVRCDVLEPHNAEILHVL